MNLRIEKSPITPELSKMVLEGFSQHATATIGFDGGIKPFSFVAYDDDIVSGIIDCKLFWGALHIRWLFVQPSYRHKGIGTELIKAAESYSKELNCTFAFVETMSFQAVGFYIKNHFTIEFSRSGFSKETTLHYLKKDFPL